MSVPVVQSLPLTRRPEAFSHPDWQGDGERLFELACERDLEGIVAKHRLSRYVIQDGNPAWLKIRNRRYSQLAGRDELFERRYEEKGAPEIGWDVCDRAAIAGG